MRRRADLVVRPTRPTDPRTRTSVTASAPSRIDLAGGTLDIWPISVIVPHAVTVNVAIELRARVTIESIDEPYVRIRSIDRRRGTRRRLPLRLERASGPLALLLRLAASFEPGRGLSIVTRAAAPAGAGLGGSSTLGIAVGAALDRWSGARLSSEALLRRVMNLETIELRVPTGNQDYLSALNGGLAAYHHEPDATRREVLPVPADLEARLVLAYTGEPRQSGFSNWDMYRRFIAGEAATVRRMEAIARIARELRDALAAENLDAAGRLIGEEGRLRYRLAPSVATPLLLAVGRAARRAGALGVKVCGAGGGGCLVALSASGRTEAVKRAIEATGARILPSRLARTGLSVRRGRAGISERSAGW